MCRRPARSSSSPGPPRSSGRRPAGAEPRGPLGRQPPEAAAPTDAEPMLAAIGATDQRQAADQLDRQLMEYTHVSFEELMRGAQMVVDARRQPVNTATFNWIDDFLVRGGMTLLRSREIDAANNGIRQRMLRVLTGTTLPGRLWDLIRPLDREHYPERGAYIFSDGRLSRVVTQRDTHSHLAGPRPPGNVVGYVHTHPPSPILAPPTMRSDFQFDASLPVQLMVEAQSARVWGIFLPNLTALLGRVVDTGFQQLNPNDPRAGIIYQLINPADERARREDQARRRTR